MTVWRPFAPFRENNNVADARRDATRTRAHAPSFAEMALKKRMSVKAAKKNFLEKIIPIPQEFYAGTRMRT